MLQKKIENLVFTNSVLCEKRNFLSNPLQNNIYVSIWLKKLIKIAHNLYSYS